MKYLKKGAFHLHSSYSDGTGTIKEIAGDSKKAGLDWIVITDHNSLSGLKNGEEGWYGSLAVIIGNEISPDTCNHYLAVGINEEIPPESAPEDVIKNVKSGGGIGFVAHPDESTTRRNKFPALRWTDWSIRGFDGIEIWNYMSDWTDNYNERLGLYCALARHSILKGPTKNTLKWWDDLNNETDKIVPAIGGLDTHAFSFGVLRIFPYLDSFKTITNYLYLDSQLSSDFSQAKKQILNALKSGNNIIVNRTWSKNSDSAPDFRLENKKLLVNLPQKAALRILRNGEVIVEKKAKNLELDNLLPGKYRFEAYYRNKPWIFSNPLSLRES